MDLIWIAALAVLWLGVVQMVAGLHKLQAGKGERP
jgi:hypothetical protein